MIIQCTACRAQARIPDSKEGAKVRCPECGHVYVARPPGARRGGKKQDPTMIVVIVGAVVVFAVIAMLASKGGGDDGPVVTAAPAEESDLEPLDTGWDSLLVKLVRDLHDQAFSKASSQLYVTLDFERAWAQRAAGVAEDAEAGTPPEDPTAPEDAGPVAVATDTPWAALGQTERSDFQNGLVDELLEGTLVADWKPYDGLVVFQERDDATVRVRVAHRDAALALADRWVEWRLAREAGRWKAYHWLRWISPEEEKAERRARSQKTVKRTLSDGSFVIEGEVRSEIEYHEETPQELRDEIEGQITAMIDLTARPKDVTAARLRLTEIGKHAVPGLLKRMGEIPMDSEDHRIQLNLIHMLLTDITGYRTTFAVDVAMGTTEERIDSGLKQWFGWYDRKWKRFWREAGTTEEEPDPLWDDPDFRPRNEREAREFERLRRERAEGGDG